MNIADLELGQSYSDAEGAVRRIAFRLDVAPQSLQTSGKRLIVVAGKPRFFRDKKAQGFRDSVAMLAAAHRPAQPLEGALRVEFRFILPRPQAKCRRSFPPGRLPCSKRPDVDNLIKSTSDVLTEARFWLDDGQIADARILKFYAAAAERPCIEVIIDVIEPILL